MKKAGTKRGRRREKRSLVAETLARDGSGPVQERAERKLDAILSAAADLMAKRGYGNTSIRDVAKRTGCSLAGMYYYFQGKEDLLFQIQYHTFQSLYERQCASLAEVTEPEEQLRLLVRNHLDFFTRHHNELKVCGYELESLADDQFRDVKEVRRRYFKLTAEVVGALTGRTGRRASDRAMVRHATMYIFGMLNWIYMWYDAKRDRPVDVLEKEMLEFILGGLERITKPRRTS